MPDQSPQPVPLSTNQMILEIVKVIMATSTLLLGSWLAYLGSANHKDTNDKIDATHAETMNEVVAAKQEAKAVKAAVVANVAAVEAAKVIDEQKAEEKKAADVSPADDKPDEPGL